MDVAAAFERVPFLRSLNHEERERLYPYAERRTFRQDERCWLEGQPSGEFVFILKGRMKLAKSAETGRDTILEMAGPGELLCASAVCCFSPYCCTSASMEEGTQVLIIPRRDILSLVERSPQVSRAFVREVTGRGVSMCQRVEELASGQVEQRIAMLLLKLADRTGVINELDKSIRIPVPLTRQDIADLCGTTVESAIRTMSRFRKVRLVTSAARGFVVHDRDDLAEIAGGRRSVPRRLNVVRE